MKPHQSYELKLWGIPSKHVLTQAIPVRTFLAGAVFLMHILGLVRPLNSFIKSFSLRDGPWHVIQSIPGFTLV